MNFWEPFQQMPSPQNALEDRHYNGLADSQPSIAGALENELCPPKQCCYQISDTQFCLEAITCGSVSEHMRKRHGVLAQPAEELVVCEWVGCGKAITRKNIYRHFREKHLEHKRGVGHV